MLVILEMSPDTAIDKSKTEDNKDLKLSSLGQQINERVSQEHKIEDEGSSKMYVFTVPYLFPLLTLLTRFVYEKETWNAVESWPISVYSPGNDDVRCLISFGTLEGTEKPNILTQSHPGLLEEQRYIRIDVHDTAERQRNILAALTSHTISQQAIYGQMNACVSIMNKKRMSTLSQNPDRSRTLQSLISYHSSMTVWSRRESASTTFEGVNFRVERSSGLTNTG